MKPTPLSFFLLTLVTIVLGVSATLLFAKETTQAASDPQTQSSATKEETESYPAFSQKAGMIEPQKHSVYLRTNDEYTSFSTLFIGYRYGMTQNFQWAIELGAGIPNLFLAKLITHTRIFESHNHTFFIGLRTRTGFKYQDNEIIFKNSTKFRLDDHRVGFIAAADLTFALRLGAAKRYAIYYTIYPLFDIDVTGRPTEIYLAPIHIGYEVRFRHHPSWSFAIESGIFFPLNDVPSTSWLRFPNLANFGFYYRF